MAVTKYAVIGQGTITNGTGNCTGSPKRLVPGDNTINVTKVGTFTVSMCAGTSASAKTGTTTVTGSPKACGAGADTTVTTTGSTGTITITVTYASTGIWGNNWSWSLTSGGRPNTAYPNSTLIARMDANSFTAASQVLTCTGGAALNVDWTGATNTPSFVLSGTLNVAAGGLGNFTAITDMTVTHTGTINAYYNFDGGGHTWNIINLAGTGWVSYTNVVNGSNTYDTLNFSKTIGGEQQIIIFQDGTNHTVTTPVFDGRQYNLRNTIQGSGTGGYTLTKAGGGIVVLKNLNISYATFAPANAWWLGEDCTLGEGVHGILPYKSNQAVGFSTPRVTGDTVV